MSSTSIAADRDLAGERFAQFVATGADAPLAEALELVAPELLRVARRLTGDDGTAADLTQETFLAALRGRARFRGGQRLLPWLLGILHNLHRYWRRAAARTPDPQRLPARSVDDPVVLLEHKFLHEAVDQAIAALPPRYREVVALHLRDGLAPEGIARALHRTPATIRTQLFRGLRRLRAGLPPGVAGAVLVCLTVRSAQAAVAASAGTPATHRGSECGPGASGRIRWTVPRARLGGWRAALAGALLLTGALTLGWPGEAADAAAVLPAPAAPRSAPESEAAAGMSLAAGRAALMLAAPAPAPGSVRVALSWRDGSPAGGQSVRLLAGLPAGESLLHGWAAAVRSAWTDAAGVAQFDAVPAGSVRVMLDDGKVLGAEHALVPGRQLALRETLRPGCRIAGRVVDESGAPVAGAAVWLSSTRGVFAPGYVAGHADAAGEFVVHALHPRWALWATAAGCAASHLWFEADPVAVSRPQLRVHRNPARVCGTVVDATGAPQAGVLVGAFPLSRGDASLPPAPPRHGYSDAAGGFALEDLAAGPHLLAAWSATGCAAPQPLTLDDGGSGRAAFVLMDGATVRGRAAGLPAGALLVATPGDLVGAAQACGVLGVTSRYAAVAADGSFALAHVPAGAVELIAVHDSLPGGHRPLAQVVARDGETCTVDLGARSDDRVELRGELRDETGAPLAGATVLALPEGCDLADARQDLPRAVTRSDGTFALVVRAHLPLQCLVEERGGLPVPVGEPVRPAQVAAPLRLQRCAADRATAALRGQLQLPAALRAHDVDLELVALPRGRRLRVPLGRDGRFLWRHLPAGDYSLRAVRGDADPGARLGTFTLGVGERRDLGGLELSEPGTLVVTLDLPAARAAAAPAGEVRVRSQRDGLLAVACAASACVTLELAPDQYVVECVGAEFPAARAAVTVGTGSRASVALALLPAPTAVLKLASRERNSGRLWLAVSGPDGAVARDEVLVVPDDGVFRLALGLLPGRHLVRARTATGLWAEGALQVPSDPTAAPATLDLVLR